MIKRKISLLLAAAVVATGVGAITPAFAADASNSLPKVYYAAPTDTMVEQNDIFSYVVQSQGYEGQVQYRIYVQNLETGVWGELTNGYSDPVDADVTFTPETVKGLPAGKYRAAIYVKRAGEDGARKNAEGVGYDTYVVKNFSVKEDGYFSNRVDFSPIQLKDTYKVGEEIVLKGNNGDKFQISYYNPSVQPRANGWVKATEYSNEAKVKFDKPGIYMLDIWGMEANPTDAVKKQGYGGWKLKVINVVEDETPTQEVVPTVEEISPGIAVGESYVKVSLNVDDPENYKVSVCGVELSNQGDYFDGLVQEYREDVIKNNIVVTPIEKVAIPTATVEEISSGIAVGESYVRVKLDTDTPEKFTVKVCGTELENQGDYFDGLVQEYREDVIKGAVEVSVK